MMMFVILVWHRYNHYCVVYAIKNLIGIWTYRSKWLFGWTVIYVCLGHQQVTWFNYSRWQNTSLIKKYPHIVSYFGEHANPGCCLCGLDCRVNPLLVVWTPIWNCACIYTSDNTHMPAAIATLICDLSYNTNTYMYIAS